MPCVDCRNANHWFEKLPAASFTGTNRFDVIKLWAIPSIEDNKAGLLSKSVRFAVDTKSVRLAVDTRPIS